MPRQFGGAFSNAWLRPACWRKAPSFCGVSLLAVSYYSPTDARHASLYESGQSLRPERFYGSLDSICYFNPAGCNHPALGSAASAFLFRRAAL